ncbi:MAG: alpha/beta fold hydrolase [Planctomycetota bacterium]
MIRALCLATLLVPTALAAAQQEPIVELKNRTIPVRGGQYVAATGKLRVREDRSNPASRTIELAFAQLTATTDEPGPPLIVLPGGPGNGATGLARSPIWRRYLELGDVVLMDPRGVGRSQPDLRYRAASFDATRLFADRAGAIAAMCALGREAATHYADQGIEIGGYHTQALADDIEALRRALGYEQVHALGHSYGTHLGLCILRRHPGTIARFVAVATAGTGDMMKRPGDLDRSLSHLSEVIAQDSVVGSQMPDFAALVAEVVADLAREPLPVPVLAPHSGAEVEVPLGPFGLRLLLLADLGDTNDLPVFPRLLHTLRQRDPSLVRWFLQKRVDQFAALPGMMLAVRGASGATAARWQRIRDEGTRSPFGVARCMFSPELDEALGVRDLGDAFRAPVVSDVPTLLVSGTLDAHTPPEQAERVRQGLPNAGHLVVEHGGHEDLLPDPEVQARILAFLAGGAPTDERLSRPPLRFAALDGDPGDVTHPALDAGR